MSIDTQRNIESNLKKMGELPNSPIAKLKGIIETHGQNSVIQELKFGRIGTIFDKRATNFLKSLSEYGSTTVNIEDVVLNDIFINAQASLAVLNLYQKNSFDAATNGLITEKDILVCINFLFAFNLFSDSKLSLENKTRLNILDYFTEPDNPALGLSSTILPGHFIALKDVVNYLGNANVTDGQYTYNEVIMRCIPYWGLKDNTVISLLSLSIPRYGAIILKEDGARIVEDVYNVVSAQPAIPQPVKSASEPPAKAPAPPAAPPAKPPATPAPPAKPPESPAQKSVKAASEPLAPAPAKQPELQKAGTPPVSPAPPAPPAQPQAITPPVSSQPPVPPVKPAPSQPQAKATPPAKPPAPPVKTAPAPAPSAPPAKQPAPQPVGAPPVLPQPSAPLAPGPAGPEPAQKAEPAQQSKSQKAGEPPVLPQPPAPPVQPPVPPVQPPKPVKSASEPPAKATPADPVPGPAAPEPAQQPAPQPVGAPPVLPQPPEPKPPEKPAPAQVPAPILDEKSHHNQFQVFQPQDSNSDPESNPDLAKLIKIRNNLLAIAIALALSGAIATGVWATLTNSATIFQFSPLIGLSLSALIIIGKIIKLSCDIKEIEDAKNRRISTPNDSSLLPE